VKLCQFSSLSWQPQDGWKHIFGMHFLFILSQWKEGGRAWRPLRGRIWSEDSQKEPRASTRLTAWLGPSDQHFRLTPLLVKTIEMTYDLWLTAGARIIERSQEYKSTVKSRTFVLLRVPIPRGGGKFNYRTGTGKH
jgi:hypothetical protein